MGQPDQASPQLALQRALEPPLERDQRRERRAIDLGLGIARAREGHANLGAVHRPRRGQPGACGNVAGDKHHRAQGKAFAQPILAGRGQGLQLACVRFHERAQWHAKACFERVPSFVR